MAQLDWRPSLAQGPSDWTSKLTGAPLDSSRSLKLGDDQHDLTNRALIAFIYAPAASANNCSRKAERCILVADIGHSSTNLTTLGTLNDAIWPSQ